MKKKIILIIAFICLFLLSLGGIFMLKKERNANINTNNVDNSANNTTNTLSNEINSEDNEYHAAAPEVVAEKKLEDVKINNYNFNDVKVLKYSDDTSRIKFTINSETSGVKYFSVKVYDKDGNYSQTLEFGYDFERYSERVILLVGIDDVSKIEVEEIGKSDLFSIN